ncbi:hypothetical protein QN277_016423 [Acacia crassicarpa]|uniref:Uncharacterized protein n=1 Tax=Acacia crassicarpa TaxID=499986 RepID=A0AAE1MWQ1_9FABA|nr:hypothetical protein QN277_016423 [Acacia crassicarpa]
MVGALSIVGSSALDSLAGPCLRFNALPTTGMNLKSGGDTVLWKKQSVKRGAMQLSSSFIDAGREWRLCGNKNPRKLRSNRRAKIVNELGGQYETFDDVKKQSIYYVICMGARTVLQELYEMNPTKYRWLYELATNKPGDGKPFIGTLDKEKQGPAERELITMLHLYGKWIKKCSLAMQKYNLAMQKCNLAEMCQEISDENLCNLAEICQEISDENLEPLRERLMETTKWRGA